MYRKIAYWLFTGLLAAWLIAGGGFDITHAQGALAILRQLGYPEYLSSILGVAKLLAVPVLLYAKWPTLREWAYAGVTFDGLRRILFASRRARLSRPDHRASDLPRIRRNQLCSGANPELSNRSQLGQSCSSSPRRLLTRTIVAICSEVSRDNRFLRTDSA